jgi:hypothetical protein
LQQRCFGVASALWLVGGASAELTETLMQELADEVRVRPGSASAGGPPGSTIARTSRRGCHHAPWPKSDAAACDLTGSPPRTMAVAGQQALAGPVFASVAAARAVAEEAAPRVLLATYALVGGLAGIRLRHHRGDDTGAVEVRRRPSVWKGCDDSIFAS